MGFVLKKIVGLLIQPLSVVLVLLIAASVLLWRKRALRLSPWLVSAGTLLLLLISLQFVPFWIGRALETAYPTYAAPSDSAGAPAYIIVLGGGVRDDPTLPLTSRLSPTALVRVVEGVRIAHLHPTAKLILSGGRVFGEVAEAHVAGQVARTLGVDPSRIIEEAESRDTHEQAILARRLVGRERLVLVTSASHMPRSMALFRKQGLEPVPAPTAHLFDGRIRRDARTLMPSAEHLRALEVVMHEVYGLTWAWGTGKI